MKPKCCSVQEYQDWYKAFRLCYSKEFAPWVFCKDCCEPFHAEKLREGKCDKVTIPKEYEAYEKRQKILDKAKLI